MRNLTAACAVAAASLWLRGGFPVHAIGTAVFDDALFVHAAQSLGAGQWLGAYTPTTLAKGVFYPFFVLVSFLASVPLLIAEHAVYLAACGGMAVVVARRSSATLGLLLFAALAFNPVLWTSELSRVIREGLYVSLTLGCVGLTVAAVFAPSRRARLAVGLALGGVLGAFWLTREEGPWLLPALAAVPIVLLIPRGSDLRRTRALRVAAPLGIALAVSAGMVLCVAAENWRVYGVFLTTEFQGGAFPRAYGALARIELDRPQRHVLFPAETHAAAYAASPAAAELAPVLDGPRGRAWASTGCTQTATNPCPGILTGWFMWALREAAASAGHGGSALAMQEYFDRLAREVNAACGTGQLKCGPLLSGLAPRLRWDDIGETMRSAGRLALLVLRVPSANIGSQPSVGSPYQLAVFTDMAGPIASGATERLVISGWVAGDGGTPEVRIAGEGAEATLDTRPMPDTADPFPGSKALRFDIETTCTGCALVVTGSDGNDIAMPFAGLQTGPIRSGPGTKVTIDVVGIHNPVSSGAKLRAARVSIARTLAAAYGLAMPYALALALAGLLASLARARRRPPPLPLVALMAASAVAAVSRIMLLAYLDATSIPSVNGLYASPVSPLVISFAMAGIWLGWSTVRQFGATTSEGLQCKKAG